MRNKIKIKTLRKASNVVIDLIQFRSLPQHQTKLRSGNSWPSYCVKRKALPSIHIQYAHIHTLKHIYIDTESPPHFLPQAGFLLFICMSECGLSVVFCRQRLACCLLPPACCLLLVAYFVRCYLPLWHNGAYLHKSISLAFNNLNNTRTMRGIEVAEWLWCALA